MRALCDVVYMLLNGNDRSSYFQRIPSILVNLKFFFCFGTNSEVIMFELFRGECSHGSQPEEGQPFEEYVDLTEPPRSRLEIGELELHICDGWNELILRPVDYRQRPV